MDYAYSIAKIFKVPLFCIQVKEEAQQLALMFETVGAFKVKRKGGKGKQIFGRWVKTEKMKQADR